MTTRAVLRCVLALIAAIAFTGLVAAPAAHAERLLSLGDSYSSGEGNAPYDSESDANRCHRSANAWPRLMGIPKERHLACSGAKIENILERGQKPTKPDDVDQLEQLEALTPTTTIDRVVMTIGGNDEPVKFASRLRNCYLVACLADVDRVLADMPAFQTRIQGVYERVQQASGVPLLVVGYPDLFPRPGSASAGRVSRHCAWMSSPSLSRLDRLARALDSAMSAAAAAAGADYLSMRDVFAGHELCTGSSYVRAIGNGVSAQQGHPLYEGQVEMALRVLRWVAQHRPKCAPTDNVAAIVDDSGSMEENDPQAIRRRALELLLTKPTNQPRTFGAVEFAGDGGPLFTPWQVGPNQAGMLASLGALRHDGYADDDGTDYNAAFAASTQQAGAGARIFLTDGGHNAGPYLEGHSGGPPTYVIGLNIGPPSEGDEAATLLSRIATESGGRYFPLRLAESDTPEIQQARLQPALNAIDSSIGCSDVAADRTVAMTAPGRPAPAAKGMFGPQPGMEIVVSWPNPGVDVDVSAVTAYDRDGRVVGDLAGTKRIGKGKRKRTKIVTSTVEGQTFDTVTLRRPAYGRVLAVKVSAPVLPEPTPVTIQMRPVDIAPTQTSAAGVPASHAPPPAAITPPAPANPTARNLVGSSPGANQVDLALDVGWAPGRDPVTCKVLQDGAEVARESCGARYAKRLSGIASGRHTYSVVVTDRDGTASDRSNEVSVEVADPPRVRVNAYDNYGGGATGRPMCRGNPNDGASMPGGTLTQTFTVPPGVASLDTALVQIDPDNRVQGTLALFVNGTQRATAAAAAAGDTTYAFPAVAVGGGEQVSLRIAFNASFGKIITVYTVGGGRGTFTASNGCSAGGSNLSTTSTALRAQVSGWNR